eukprot:8935459-Karenia_brevis.AAC.1
MEKKQVLIVMFSGLMSTRQQRGVLIASNTQELIGSEDIFVFAAKTSALKTWESRNSMYRYQRDNRRSDNCYGKAGDGVDFFRSETATHRMLEQFLKQGKDVQH